MKLKTIPIILVSMICIFALSVSPTKTKAYTGMQIVVWSLPSSVWTPSYAYLQANRPGWYNNYDYFYFSHTAYYLTVMLVPKGNAKLFLGNNQGDTDYTTMDQWTMDYVCSTAQPCLFYRFNNAGQFQAVQSQSTSESGVVVSSSSAFKLFYTNYPIYTFLSYVIGNGVYSVVQTTIAGGIFGINPIPKELVPEYVSQTTDKVLADALIDANWGMFNFMKDFLNYCYASVMEVLNGLASATASAFGALFISDEDFSIGMSIRQERFVAALPFVAEVSGFFNGLSTTGTSMPLITGTIFGSPVSFDMKRDIFDPFLPIANSFKLIFKFVIWLPFLRLLWKQSERIINGLGG